VQPRGGQAQIRGNMPIPSDGTTFSHNIKEDGPEIFISSLEMDTKYGPISVQHEKNVLFLYCIKNVILVPLKYFPIGSKLKGNLLSSLTKQETFILHQESLNLKSLVFIFFKQ
jgi:hypothetical protein